MEIEGTDQEVSFGFALASFFLSIVAVAEMTSRDGVVDVEKARGLFSKARRALEDGVDLLPNEAATTAQIAKNLLLLPEQWLRAASAEKGGRGPH